jgi:hypothetical protein
MIELSDLIHHCNDACVKSFFNDEWNDYIDHKVNPNMKMFSRRLCVQEAHDPLSIEDEFKLDTKTESINDSNPFKSSKEENVVTVVIINNRKKIGLDKRMITIITSWMIFITLNSSMKTKQKCKMRSSFRSSII